MRKDAIEPELNRVLREFSNYVNLENIFHHQEYFFRESSLFFEDLLGVARFLSGVRTIP